MSARCARLPPVGLQLSYGVLLVTILRSLPSCGAVAVCCLHPRGRPWHATRSTNTAPTDPCARRCSRRASNDPGTLRVHARLHQRAGGRTAREHAGRCRDSGPDWARAEEEAVDHGLLCGIQHLAQWHPLALHRGQHARDCARILQPAIVTLGVFYVVVWGYLQLIGKIEEPFMEGVKRLLTLALILGLSLHLWLYNEVIVDTFFTAPTSLASGIIAARNPGGAYDPVGVVDQIFFDGDDAASLLMQKGEIFGRDIIFYFAGFAVYLMVGLTAVYTMFLLALSKIALSV